MHFNIKAIAFLLFINLFSLSAAHPNSFKLDHISAADGLPHISVSTILQDSKGLIWLGTQGGLASYDGYEFTVSEHDPFSENTLNHNLIQTMFMDNDDTIWIGTYDGLAHYFPLENRFVQYKHNKNNMNSLSNSVVVSILRDSKNNLWAGTLNGLNLLNEETGSFTRFRPLESDPSNTLPHKVVRSIFTDSRGQLWIGTYGGLSLYNYNTESFRTWNTETNPALPENAVMSIKENPNNKGELWMGVWGSGLVKFSIDTKITETISLPDNRTYTLLFDDKGSLWTGTWGGGLIIYNPADKTIVQHKQNSNYGLSHNTIYSLLQDNSGMIWIGTNGGGINQYARWKNNYKYYIGNDSDNIKISQGKVNTIYQEKNETLWVGVYNGGLNRRDPDTDIFKHYRNNPENPKSLSNDIVNFILRDSRKNLWIGTNKGLNLYNETNDNFSIYKIFPEDIPLTDEIVYCMTEDSDGQLWIGTYTNGAALYNPETDSFTYFPSKNEKPLSDNLIRDIYEDKQGDIWFATNNGLNRWNPETRTMKQYLHDSQDKTSLSNNNVLEIKEDNDGDLWICTNGGGANLYNPETDDFSHLTTKDGLISNILTGIEIKKNGDIWFISTYGISIYNKPENSFRNLLVHSSLVGEELTKGHMIDEQQNIYLGNNMGFTIIPDIDIEQQKWQPDLFFTDVKVMGQSLEKIKWIENKITLAPSNNYITFNFAMNEYTPDSMKQYAYKMEGIDKDWIESGKRHRANYSNLAPGLYEFKIKGAGRTGIWNKEGQVMTVTILPHFWQSFYFKLLYGFIVILVIITVTMLLKRRQMKIKEELIRTEEANRELEEKVRLRTRDLVVAKDEAENALHAKSLFLANMSHEVRTPLNGIIGMTSLIMKTELTTEQKKYLDYTKISSDNLLILVNDILNIERINSGKINIENSVFSLRKTLSYIFELVRVQAEKKQLEFHWEIEETLPDVLKGDSGKFMQILGNILGNSVKYTEKGYVSFSVKNTDINQKSEIITLSFTISDSGIGIPADKQETVFEIFEQVDTSYAKQYQGAGLGLAIAKKLTNLMNGKLNMNSEEGKGTEIIIDLPFHIETVKLPERENRNENLKKLSPAHILLVEDELINKFYMKRLLEDNNLFIETAENGQKAVDLAKIKKYDLILMDINMPVMSGIEAVQIIRAQSLNSQTPVIALTAHAMKDEIDKCREAGMDDFVTKPVNEKAFFKKLRYWIN